MTFASSATALLILALASAVYALAASALGQVRHDAALRLSGERAVLAVGGLVTCTAAVLWVLLATHQFSVAFVAEVSNREMSLRAVLSSFWGGQPGSLLFRTWALTLFGSLAVIVQRRRERPVLPYMIATLALIEAFFLLVLLVTANPFAQALPAPADGQGLNPLLQDEAMSFHPPLLLSGYMAFSLPFAVAVSGLLSGQMGIGWLRALRRWTLFAWGIQGCGLLAGAWWAYHVLGWGGYWGWDPVENVALMPWVVATAFLHSLMVQERRGMLRVWNVVLATAAFTLAVFGMFIVGSGVLTSVHAFATSSVGPLFFGFLAILLIGVIALVTYRLPLLKSSGQFDAVASRESAFLLNNLLLVAMVAATLWGTVFPMLSEVATGAKMGVGPGFYEQVNGPLLVVLLALMGVGPILAWRRTSQRAVLRHLLPPVFTALAVWAVLILLGMGNGLAALAFGACALTLVATFGEYLRGVRARMRSGETAGKALVALIARDRRRYAGYIVHLAVLLVACGVIGSTFQQSQEVALKPGQMVTVGRYTLTYQGLRSFQTGELSGLAATVQVNAGHNTLGTIEPDQLVYVHWEKQPVTGVAIFTTSPWLDDVYVLLTGLDSTDQATFRIFINPLVSLIWVGGALFLSGAATLFWPQQRRRPLFRPARAGRPIASEAS